MAHPVSSNGSGRLPVAGWTLLYDERVRRGVTQLKAATICGVTQQTFSGWEQKKRRPARRNRSNLALFLHISDDKLVVELKRTFPQCI